MQFIDRRDFLKTAVAAIASLILPRSLLAGKPDHSFFFIHADSCNSWPVTDPVLWSLEHARQPILERARDGLLKLTTDDGDRIVRLVTRRCRLNLIELHPEHVTVQHWGTHGLADLRPWFKAHRLARKHVEVVVKDRKRGTVITQSGDDFLYGVPLTPDFPLDLFQSKWGRRFKQEADDWQPAPGSSGFAWDGVEDGSIPWIALKSAWRRSAPGVCLNCDTPTLLVNFGLRPVGMFNRSPNFVSVCGACRRSFKDESVKDMAGWMAINLDAEVRPDAEMIWGKRAKRQ
jgi:hypothetical protein